MSNRQGNDTQQEKTELTYPQVRDILDKAKESDKAKRYQEALVYYQTAMNYYVQRKMRYQVHKHKESMTEIHVKLSDFNKASDMYFELGIDWLDGESSKLKTGHYFFSGLLCPLVVGDYTKVDTKLEECYRAIRKFDETDESVFVQRILKRARDKSDITDLIKCYDRVSSFSDVDFLIISELQNRLKQ
jgi:hypothetical protein